MVPRVRLRTGPTPLDAASLRDLALAYVARYATTEARLRRYLQTKLRARGWAGEAPPPVDALIARCAEQGFVDDAAFGEGRTRSLAARGYGPRRVAAGLAAAGIARDMARGLAEGIAAAGAARRYAERRRFGPWDREPADPARRQRQFAAMLRAGHAPAIVRAILGGGGSNGEDAD